MALTETEPTIARVVSLSAGASPVDEFLAERVVLTIVAVRAAVRVPGRAEQLTDTPLTLAGPRPRGATSMICGTWTLLVGRLGSSISRRRACRLVRPRG